MRHKEMHCDLVVELIQHHAHRWSFGTGKSLQSCFHLFCIQQVGFCICITADERDTPSIPIYIALLKLVH